MIAAVTVIARTITAPPILPGSTGARSAGSAAPRDPERASVFEAAQDRAELRQIVRDEQPPARRPSIAGDAVTGIPGGFGPMASGDGAVEHGASIS